MAGGAGDGRAYGAFAGFVFIFNLIVGVGGLAMPQAFSKAGWLLGTLFVSFVGFLSYVTVTWVVEAIAAANAVLALEEEKKQGLPLQVQGEAGISPPDARASLFEITRRTEVGAMSALFLGRRGANFFYAVMAVYLYGDLAIYGASVPLTLAEFSGPISLGSWHIADPYRLYLLLFALLVAPFCFGDFQSTRWLQYSTLATRNVALLTMIGIALARVARGDGSAPSQLRVFELGGLPTLFGTAVYAFMCHHSLPSIVAPIRDKRLLRPLLAADYACVAAVYLLLCWSADLAFGAVTAPKCASHPGPPCRLQDLYSLNFASFSVQAVSDALALFPVFTLTANFPLIAITLRNNLATLLDALLAARAAAAAAAPGDADTQALLPPGASDASAPAPAAAAPIAAAAAAAAAATGWRAWTRRHGLTLLTIVPPLLIAFATRRVGVLVSVTGAFAGLFIQYVMPLALVRAARTDPRVAEAAALMASEAAGARRGGGDGGGDDMTLLEGEELGGWAGAPPPRAANPHASPFQHRAWLAIVAGFSVLTFGMSAYNQIRRAVG